MAEEQELDEDGLIVQKYHAKVLVVMPPEGFGDQILRYARSSLYNVHVGSTSVPGLGAKPIITASATINPLVVANTFAIDSGRTSRPSRTSRAARKPPDATTNAVGSTCHSTCHCPVARS